MTRVTVTAPEAAWRALLAALPRCHCGALGEVELAGRPRCALCASESGLGPGRALPHADAAGAVTAALSPIDVEGRWEADDDG